MVVFTRSLNKRRYIFAFVITAAIFFLGFFFGFLMDIQRINYFESLNEVQKLNIRSLQLQDDLVKDGSLANQCAALRYMFDKAVVDLENSRERLDIYERQSKVKKEDFEILKREYVLSQINFWGISKNLKKICPDSSDFAIIIYFYSDEKTCPRCEDQAIVLNYYKSILKENILIFSIYEKFEEKEPLITLLKQSYGIKEYPSLVIEDKTFHGFVTEEDMRKTLCSVYKTNKTRDIIVCDGMQ